VKSIKKAWSQHSQKNRIELARLEGERVRCEGLISHYQGFLKNLEDAASYQVGMATRGDGIADARLPQALADLADRQRQLQAYKDHSASLQAKIDTLDHRNPLQVAERVEKQDLLSKLAIARLEKDRLADLALQHLRQVLKERGGLSVRMSEAAATIDFSFGDDGMDENRLAILLASLPADLVAASERWTAEFLGEKQDAKPYVACGKPHLVMPESLASHGVFQPGDRIFLSDEVAAELLSKNRAGGAAIALALEKSPLPA
jgi:hypothetical protein